MDIRLNYESHRTLSLEHPLVCPVQPTAASAWSYRSVIGFSPAELRQRQDGEAKG